LISQQSFNCDCHSASNSKAMLSLQRVTGFRWNYMALLSVVTVFHSFTYHHCNHCVAESRITRSAFPILLCSAYFTSPIAHVRHRTAPSWWAARRPQCIPLQRRSRRVAEIRGASAIGARPHGTIRCGQTEMYGVDKWAKVATSASTRRIGISRIGH
jgi:hypothetical protein